MKVSETVELTGEIIEFAPGNQTELTEDYLQVSKTIKAYEAIKKKLAKQAEQYIGVNGTSEPVNGYMFRQSSIQRMTYDKAILRQVIDQDTLDALLEPNKKLVDNYLKENLEELGEASTRLRESMIATGNPYSVTKLEKVN